ncbi:hypothetical protein EXIGLDRAFT_718209, partial [Exidia glandulosa HHB12029]
MPKSFAPVLLALLIISNALAKFTTPGCWGRNCLVQNDAGALCLQAKNDEAPSACSDEILLRLLDVHVHSNIGLSIAYYDERGHFLGPTIWPVPAPLPFAVYVCMTGRRSDDNGRYRTLCRTALHDDDVYNASAYDRACAVERPQTFVSDGCYTVPHKSLFDSNALTVLGGIVTVVTVVCWFLKPLKLLKGGWRYFATSRYGRRMLGVSRREELIPRAFDISLYPPGTVTRRQGNAGVDVRDLVTIAQPATALYRP